MKYPCALLGFEHASAEVSILPGTVLIRKDPIGGSEKVGRIN
jgi:hypothetical protein